MRIKDIFTKRRSAMNFREDFKMNEIDFNTIFELARYSPSVFNTQGVRYIVTTDKDKQLKLKELSYGQHKIYSASGVIVVLADRDFLEESNLRKVYEPMINLKMMSEDDYLVLSEQFRQFRNSLTDKEAELETYRNTFVNVGILISIITVLGFDTCPMHIHNVDKIRELFNIPDNLEPIFLLPVGKATDTERPGGYRHQVDELVKFEKYK